MNNILNSENEKCLRRRTMSKTYVETSTYLLEGIDEMVREGYYKNRTEGVNDAIRQLLKRYKVSKLHVKDSKTFKEKEKQKENK